MEDTSRLVRFETLSAKCVLVGCDIILAGTANALNKFATSMFSVKYGSHLQDCVMSQSQNRQSHL